MHPQKLGFQTFNSYQQIYSSINTVKQQDTVKRKETL